MRRNKSRMWFDVYYRKIKKEKDNGGKEEFVYGNSDYDAAVGAIMRVNLKRNEEMWEI